MNNKIVEAILLLQEVGKSTPELDAQLAEVQAAENTDEDTKEETETEPEATEPMTVGTEEGEQSGTVETGTADVLADTQFNNGAVCEALGGKPIAQLTAEDFEKIGQGSIYWEIHRLLREQPEVGKQREAEYHAQASTIGWGNGYSIHLEREQKEEAAWTKYPDTYGIKPAAELTRDDLMDLNLISRICRLDPRTGLKYEREYKVRAEEIAQSEKKAGNPYWRMIISDLNESFRVCKKCEKEEAKQRAEDLAAAKAHDQDIAKNGMPELYINATRYTNLPDYITGNQPIGYAYTADDKGIMAQVIARDGSKYPEIICKTPMLINKIMQGDQDDVMIELAYNNTGRWLTKVLPLRSITNWQRIPDLLNLGIMVQAKHTQDMANFFQSMYDSIKGIQNIQLHMVDGIGFNPDFSKFYFGCEEGIYIKGANGKSQSAISRDITPKGDRQVSYDTLCEIRATGIKMFYAALAANLASPMVSMLGETEGYWLNIYGNSRAGKSKAAFFAGSICGDMRKGHLMQSLRGSIPGREARLAYMRNLPINFEDYNNLSRKEKEAVPSFIMFTSNGTGREVKNRDGSTRDPMHWQLGAISTSENREDEYATNNGVINRALFWAADSRECNWSRQQIGRWLDLCIANNGWIIRDWVQILIKIGRKKIRTMYDNAKKEIEKSAAGMGKVLMVGQTECAALLLLADNLAERLIWKDGYGLTASDFAQKIDEETAVDRNECFYDNFRAWFGNNTPHFDGHKNATEKTLNNGMLGIYIPERQMKNGAAKPAYVCVSKTTLESLLKNYETDYTLWIYWARQKGILDPEADSRDKKTGVIKQGRPDPHTNSTYLGTKPRMIRIALPLSKTEEEEWAAAETTMKKASEAAFKPDVASKVDEAHLATVLRDLGACGDAVGCGYIVAQLTCAEWTALQQQAGQGRTQGVHENPRTEKTILAALAKADGEGCRRILGALSPEEKESVDGLPFTA